MKNILREFQLLEENHINLIKDSLRKFNVYQMALNRNLQYDYEKNCPIIVQTDQRHKCLWESLTHHRTYGSRIRRFAKLGILRLRSVTEQR